MSLHKIKGEVISGSELSQYEHYFHDQSSYPYVIPEYLIFAHSVEDVQSVVHYAYETNRKITIVGGRTGYSGGANSCGGIVLSLEKLNKVRFFEPHNLIITVEAGMVTDAISQFTEDYGLMYPVKFAASGSSQIGGNIATNAGGVHVVRYGMTRSQVLALQVVTGRGEVLKTSAPVFKDNSGISLKDIFIGSEGRLGIITEATLRLVAKPENLITLVAATESFGVIHELLALAFRFPILHAFEFWDAFCYELILEKVTKKPLFSQRYPYYVLIEWEAERKLAESFVELALEKNLVSDALYSESLSGQKNLWQWRERISEELKKNFVLYKYDISIPLPMQTKFIDRLKLTLEKDFPNMKIFLFGHVADGNLHVNVADVSNETDKKDKIDEFVYNLVLEFSGSISAEHGLGKVKKFFYQKFFPLNWYYNQKLKEVFDTKSIFCS